MGRLISVDPGNNSGIAVWDDGLLVSAYLVEDSAPSAQCLGAECVVEIPRIYPTGKGKGDPNDLIKVAYVAGRIAAGASHVVRVFPYQWKGQVDPDVLILRVQGCLTPQEVLRVTHYSASKAHNVWDAIGIGLWYLKRMGAGGR